VVGENESSSLPVVALTLRIESLWSYGSPTPDAPLPTATNRLPSPSTVAPGGVQMPASRVVGTV
jgi:hypothetical protein